MGNFFPMMVCALFDAFWLSNGMLHLPTLNLAAPYSVSGTDGVAGEETQAFNASLAMYNLVWGFALLTYTIFTTRTNVVFFLIFLLSALGAFLPSGSFWKVSINDLEMAHNLQVVSS